MFEKKYEFIFLRKEYGTMYLVGSVKRNNLTQTIRLKEKTFTISIDKPSFSKKITKVFIFDYDSGSQMKFDEIKAILNPSELDMIISNQFVKELTQGAISNTKDKVINMIIGGIIGGLFAVMIMFFYMQSKIEEIYANMPTFSSTIGGI